MHTLVVLLSLSLTLPIVTSFAALRGVPLDEPPAPSPMPNGHEVQYHHNDPYIWFVVPFWFASILHHVIAATRDVLNKQFSEREIVQYVLQFYHR